jgi:hypothetical protein
MEAGAGSDDLTMILYMTEHGICPGPSICYIYSGIKYGELLSVHKFTNEIYREVLLYLFFGFHQAGV